MDSQASAQNPELRFMPGTWYEIRPGDRIVSRSGTVRTVLNIVPQKGKLSLSFRTSRPGGDIELETAYVHPHAIQGIKEVIRGNSSSGAASEFDTPAEIAVPAEPPLNGLPAVEELRLDSWSDIRVGDIIVSRSGTRRLISGLAESGGELMMYCLMRGVDGRIDDSFFTATDSLIEAVECVYRAELREGEYDEPSHRMLPPGILATIETLMGRGDLGDAFIRSTFSALSAPSDGPVTVEIQASVEPTSFEILEFLPKSAKRFDLVTCTLEVALPADETAPLSISNVQSGPTMSPVAFREIARCAMLSNTLRGCF